MNRIIQSISMVSNFIINGFIILLIASIFVDGPLSFIGIILLLILVGAIVFVIGFLIWDKIRTWLYFDWMNQ